MVEKVGTCGKWHKLVFNSCIFNAWIIFCLPFLAGMHVGSLHASPKDPFEVVLPVTSQSESERVSAFNKAMGIVLQRLSGNNRWENSPTMSEAINNASRYVNRYGYIEAESKTEPVHYNLHIRFGSKVIKQLLESNHYPVWTDIRPPVLVWIDFPDTQGIQSAYENNRNTVMKKKLSEAFRQLGLQANYPLLDFIDMKALPESAIQHFDKHMILNASTRYKTPAVMVLNAYASGDEPDLVNGSLALFFQGTEHMDSFEKLTIDQIAEKAASFAIIPLANFYGTGRNENSAKEITLRIKGINSFEDYMSLEKYLQSKPVIQSSVPVEIADDSVKLKMMVAGNIYQLFSLDSKLQESKDEKTTTPKKTDSDYLFRWIPRSRI